MILQWSIRFLRTMIYYSGPVLYRTFRKEKWSRTNIDFFELLSYSADAWLVGVLSSYTRNETLLSIHFKISLQFFWRYQSRYRVKYPKSYTKLLLHFLIQWNTRLHYYFPMLRNRLLLSWYWLALLRYQPSTLSLLLSNGKLM